MVAISRNASFGRQRKQRQKRGTNPTISLRWKLQWTIKFGILLAVGLFYIIAKDAPIMNILLFREETSAIKRSLGGETASETTNTDAPETPLPVTISRQSLLEEHLARNNITEAGKEIVLSYANDPKQMEDQPLRHIRFSDLILQPVPHHTPVMQTAYLQSTVVAQAPWFQHHKICNDTCCAQKVAVSLHQDENRIINAVDGMDLADLLLYGNSVPPFHKFAASELTKEVIPCLRPGVIIHADSYRGPITRFFHEHRPKITVPYVFITSKTDGETPIKFFTKKLDTDPLMMAWYGINPNYLTGANHSKFRMMPLGLTGNKYRQQPELDLLMKARNYTNPFGGDKSKWTNLTLWYSAKDTTPLLFVKFGLHVNALHRERPWNMACQNRTMAPLDNISCNIGIGANPRQTYAAASKYLFGLSPPGNGLDCYRTYEYLLNGVIPVVKYQPEYQELFKDLPIIQLTHWNYSQHQLVHIMRDYVFSSEFLNNTFDKGWERLFLQYWRHKVLQDAGRLDEIITDPEGNQYYTAWQYSLYKPPHIQHATPRVAKEIAAKKEAARLQSIKDIQAAQKKEEKERHKQEEEKDVREKIRDKLVRKRGRAGAGTNDDDRDQVWNDIDKVKREIELARETEKAMRLRRKRGRTVASVERRKG